MIRAVLATWIAAAGQIPDPQMQNWFSHLSSAAHGFCCEDADGEDVQWDYGSTVDFPYRVFLDGKWMDIAKDEVVTEPNRTPRAIVWVVRNRADNSIAWIRCFIPGPSY